MGELFEQLNASQGVVTTGTCYHWSDPASGEFTRRSLDPTRSLAVSDEYYSWANYRHGGRLYKLLCAFRKPLLLLNQLVDFQVLFPYGEESDYSALLPAGGFDAVVYTPHEYGRDARQALILNPAKQLLSIHEVVDYDPVLIDAYRSKMNVRWKELRRRAGKFD
jgi:hypothetical protein